MNPETIAPRQPYTPPAVILKLDLETHAGSPLGLPLDPDELLPPSQ